MLHRMRSTWLAGAGAVLLVLSMSGLAAAATLVSDTSPEASVPTEPLVSATISTFEDINANGIDDDCETAVVAADAAIVTAALAAVDTNADGTISTTEAAQSSWVGGLNCNHGGYVSGVAGTSGDECDAAETPETPEAPEADASTENQDEAPEADAVTSTVVVTVPCVEDLQSPDATAPAAVCPVVPVVTPPVVVDPTVPVLPNAHGKAVSLVAQSDAVGGKNCNHGGAVSEAAHAAKADKLAKADHVKPLHATKAKTHGKHAAQN